MDYLFFGINCLLSFKVIRAQLPRENRFYTNEEHEDDIQMKEESDYKYP
jgi:hypothetical protein